MKKQKPCYICGDTEGQKDLYHSSRCLKCKREQSRYYAKEIRQIRLEKKFLNNEKGIKFCKCGDYFININNSKELCINCR